MKLPSKEELDALAEEGRRERREAGLPEDPDPVFVHGGVAWCGPGAEKLRDELAAAGLLPQA